MTGPSRDSFFLHRGPLVGALLGLAALAALGGWLDARRIQRLADELAVEQARLLIAHVESSTERAAVAEQLLRETVEQQLYAVAALVGRGLPAGRANVDWNALAVEGGVSRLDLFAADRSWLGGSFPLPGPEAALPGEAVDPERHEWSVGLFRDARRGEAYHGVVRRLPDGRLLRVAADAAELGAVRRRVGIGALLRDLGERPEVRYAVVDSREQLIAAAPGLPDWVEAPGDPLHERALAATGFEAEFVDTPDGPLFEARQPFGDGAVLRLGLVTPGIDQIRARAGRAIALRTALVFALALIALSWAFGRRSLALLRREKARIEREVTALEAEKSLGERLTAMGALAGGVAHEIRNPLNTIAMAAQRLELQLDPERHREHYRGVVRSIRAEAQRIERIVDDFLKVARPQPATKVLQSPSAALEQVRDSFASLAAARDVAFTCSWPALPDLRFDADQLRQAVLNLLLNALQAVPQGTGRVELVVEADERWLRARVSDNGPGVPPEKRGRVFDLYYSTRADGTGLGLPLVHRVAVDHGGRVEVGDAPGGGAVFTLHLERTA